MWSPQSPTRFERVAIFLREANLQTVLGTQNFTLVVLYSQKLLSCLDLICQNCTQYSVQCTVSETVYPSLPTFYTDLFGMAVTICNSKIYSKFLQILVRSQITKSEKKTAAENIPSNKANRPSNNAFPRLPPKTQPATSNSQCRNDNT